ncbi:hypothetical protein K438DRAFT_1935262 [Mycena galopus ATCC 62051]|nr:hypothetical protein K438DRAFT_1935262 [Mycena galopus ATCC 62051]
MACLAVMPRLRHLDISEDKGWAQFTDEVWESLTWRTNSSLLIPDLESLALLGGREFSHKAVVRMLNSRVLTPSSPAGFVPKLKAVDLQICRKMSASARWKIKAFDLDITVDHAEEGSEDVSEASDTEESDEGDSEDEESDSEDKDGDSNRGGGSEDGDTY